MKVVLLNQCFWPDIVSTAQISHDLGRALVAAGHRVTVVSARSIYGEAGDSLPPRDSVDGIEIIRVHGAMFGKRGILLRLVDFAAFYVRAMVAIMRLPRQDVVISLTTPPFIALIGVIAGWVKGSRSVYWVMDLYPDTPVACGVLHPRSPITWITERLNRFCLRRSDATVALGRCMRDLIVSKGIPPSQIHTIQVWSAEEAHLPPSAAPNPYRAEWAIGDRLLVMYSGNFGLGHDVDTMLHAAERLRNDDRIRFAFVGGGKKKAQVESFVRERELANCILAPYQPRDRLEQLLAAADVHLASLSDGVEGIMVPSKVYGMMASARPSVFIGPAASEVARAIVESGGGFVIRCGDVEDLVACFEGYAADRALVAEHGHRARASLERSYTRDQLCHRWVQLLESLVSGAGRTA